MENVWQVCWKDMTHPKLEQSHKNILTSYRLRLHKEVKVLLYWVQELPIVSAYYIEKVQFIDEDINGSD